MEYFKTHILDILRTKETLASLNGLGQHNILNERVRFLLGESGGDTALADEIEAFLKSPRLDSPGENIQPYLPSLLKYGLIAEKPKLSGKCSLAGVIAISLELTYKCNYRCKHCLQKNVRNDKRSQIGPEAVKNIIKQGYLSGFYSPNESIIYSRSANILRGSRISGINFTGGEALGYRESLFEILEYAHFLGIPYRLNTNSWWSTRRDFVIDGKQFSYPVELVKHLRDIGLKMFAFSFDDRLEDKKKMGNLVESILLSEFVGIPYQIISTGWIPKYTSFVGTLQNEIGPHVLQHFVSMEMVDIGGASELAQNVFASQHNRCECERINTKNQSLYEGFYHPEFLHINPFGEIRTCMYALGLINVGDLSKNSFTDIINGFPANQNNSIFRDPSRRDDLYSELVIPYLHLYKPMHHKCTENAILARVIEAHASVCNISLPAVHQKIAAELNISRYKLTDQSKCPEV